MDNLPPLDVSPLLDRLSETHGNIKRRAIALLEGVKNVPETVTEASIDPVIGFVKQLRAAANDAEEARIKEKHDFLEAGRTIDAFFKSFIDDLKAAAKDVQGKMDAYMETAGRTRGALGGTAFTVSTIEFEILDLETAARNLARYMDDAAVEKAARSCIRNFKSHIKGMIANGHQPFEGVRFYETTKARVA